MSIECRNINFTYFEDRKSVLSHIGGTFDAGKITVLTGKSGCGKSTLLYLFAGIYPKHAGILKSGSILVEGKNPAELIPKERCKLVGMMFQNPELQFCMDTVKNELIFCLENICEDPLKMDSMVDEALAFCGIAHLKERKLLSLSGGEKQKVMLACLAMLKPKWLLLDEPFANIDDASAGDIAHKLKQLHEKFGMGILAVDHRLENWGDVADEVRIMVDGTLVDERMQMEHLDWRRMREFGIYAPETFCREKPPETAAPVLQLSHVSVNYGNSMILRDVSASFCPGHSYAIVGESGSGKSSLFGAISGLYPHGGEILLDGKKYRAKKKTDLGKIGFVTQNPQDQFVADTVRQEILVSLKKEKNAGSLSESILRSIKLWRYRDVSAYLLSQGQQRRLGVAALLAYRCKVLLCDEPTYAQDWENTVAIMEGLCKQARENNMALIFSTHDRNVAGNYADKVFELRGGYLYEKN